MILILLLTSLVSYCFPLCLSKCLFRTLIIEKMTPSSKLLKQLFLQVTEKELLDFFNNQVPNFKKIRGGIIFRNEIPRNPIGKLLRRNMRDWAESQTVAN